MVRLDNGLSVDQVINRKKKTKGPKAKMAGGSSKYKDDRDSNDQDRRIISKRPLGKDPSAKVAGGSSKHRDDRPEELTDYQKGQQDLINKREKEKKKTTTKSTDTGTDTTTPTDPGTETSDDGSDIIINIPDFDFSGFTSYFDSIFEKDYE